LEKEKVSQVQVQYLQCNIQIQKQSKESYD